MRSNHAILAIAALLIGAAAPAQSSKYEKVETEALEKVRAAWVEAARLALDGKHDVLLIHAVDQARVAGVAAEAIKPYEGKLIEPHNYAPLTDGPEAADILKTARLSAAAAVAPLLQMEAPAAAANRFRDHLVRVLESDPKNARAIDLYQKRAASALAAKNWTVLGAYVMRAAHLDYAGYQAGKYKAAEQALAKNGGILVQGPSHLLQARVVLPEGWNAKKTWPMFVAVAGANCAYQRQLEELVSKAGKRQVLLIVPMTIGNANELPYNNLPYPKDVIERHAPDTKRPQRIEWDEIGLTDVLAEIRRRFSGTEKFFMTGYSGGGFLTHFWLQHHPDQLLGACLASANYWDWVEQKAVKPDGGGCPILIVSGSKDQAGPPRIFPQSDQAKKRLDDLGFTQVERRHLDNRDHEAFYELGLELFDKTLAAQKKN